MADTIDLANINGLQVYRIGDTTSIDCTIHGHLSYDDHHLPHSNILADVVAMLTDMKQKIETIQQAVGK